MMCIEGNGEVECILVDQTYELPGCQILQMFLKKEMVKMATS